MARTKRPLKMAGQLIRLGLCQANPAPDYVTRSYDRISDGYDQTWTHHMRDLSTDLVERLNPASGARALDLTCGTGFVTGLLAERTGQRCVGVDRSEGMIAQARATYGAHCDFVVQDILAYLRGCERDSFDVVTCAWGLGYSRPLSVLRSIRRVLKPGGRVAIIDNTLFSLNRVMVSSFLAFLEQPDTLKRVMRFRFLTGQTHLRLWFRLSGCHPQVLDAGQRSYSVTGGANAIARLRATGAAAGFEYACDPEDEEAVFKRFAEILEQRYGQQGEIAITHRYCVGIAYA
ncbi:MAG: methyltransferase domain-containing protein [Planctomycetes bacterium]|nr:methyltransferase domain-containing protein [Planctomycetota bacterium]